MPIKLDGSTGVITSTSSLTTGSVLFAGAGGGAIQDNANFFWDDTNNRLGIGTASPTVPLEVSGAVKASSLLLTTQLSVANGGTGLTSLTAGYIPYGAGTSAFGGSSTFTFNGTTDLVVPKEIYSSTTTDYIRVAGGNPAASGAYLLMFGQSHATAPGALTISSAGSGNITYHSRSGAHIWNNNSFTQAMTLDTSGRLGIATTSPGTILNIKDNSSAAIQIKTADSNFSALNIGVNTTAGHIAINSTASGGTTQPLSFQMGGTPAMTLNASGSLLVGTTSSSFIWNAGSTTTAKMAISDSGFDILNLISTANNPCLDFSQPNASGNVFRYAAVKGVMTTLTAGSEAGALTFNTSTGGANSTERMRIDSAGNVGIGTTSPGTNLHISKASVAEMRVTNTSGTTQYMDVGTQTGLNAHYIYCYGAYPLVFATNGTERARITSGGDVYFGQQTGAVPPTTGADVICGGLIINPSRRTTAATTPVCVWDSTNGVFNRSTSSLKYKRDVQDATYGLSDVLNLRPVTFKGKSESDGDRIFGGLIAEEVDAAGLTMFVDYAEDGTPDGLGYSAMVSLAFKAIQELAAEVAELKAKVA